MFKFTYCRTPRKHAGQGPRIEQDYTLSSSQRACPDFYGSDAVLRQVSALMLTDVDIASRSKDRTQTPEKRDDLKTKALLMSSRIVGKSSSNLTIDSTSSNLTLMAKSPPFPTVTCNACEHLYQACQSTRRTRHDRRIGDAQPAHAEVLRESPQHVPFGAELSLAEAAQGLILHLLLRFFSP